MKNVRSEPGPRQEWRRDGFSECWSFNQQDVEGGCGGTLGCCWPLPWELVLKVSFPEEGIRKEVAQGEEEM